MTAPSLNQSELEAANAALGLVAHFNASHQRDLGMIVVLVDGNGEIVGSIDNEADGSLCFFPGENKADGLS